MNDPTAASASHPILVIEDEASVAGFLRLALERRGYSVVLSASATDGLHLLSSQQFRGVISDVRTPGERSGADVKKWLLRNRPGLAGKFVFITGDTASAETASLLAETKTPCIEKPFRLQQFLEVVEEIIGKP